MNGKSRRFPMSSRMRSTVSKCQPIRSRRYPNYDASSKRSRTLPGKRPDRVFVGTTNHEGFTVDIFLGDEPAHVGLAFNLTEYGGFDPPGVSQLKV